MRLIIAIALVAVSVAVLSLATGTAYADVPMEELLRLQNIYWETEAAKKEAENGCMFFCAPEARKGWDAFLSFLASLERHWIMGGTKKVAHWNNKWPKRTVILYDEKGGLLNEHIKRWMDLRASNADVEIRAYCPSACTMIMAYIPKERICFDENAALLFHSARDSLKGNMLPETNRVMVAAYPPDIRQWILARGGPEKMTIQDMWVLEAPELWNMGYRKCPPEPDDDRPPVPMTITPVKVLK
jgi:hypothetical protein